MKRIMTVMSIVLMIVLGGVSCKDKAPNYPANVSSGVWSGGSASTGYGCEIYFAADNMPGSHVATITLTEPTANDAITVQGPFVYSAETGRIDVQLSGLDGGPSAAIMQFSDGGQSMELKFTSQMELGTYVLYPASYPKSIAGDWADQPQDAQVFAAFAPVAVNGGMPCELHIKNEQMIDVYPGTYTYDAATGRGSLTVQYNIVEGPQNGTVQYNTVDNTLSLVIASKNINIKLKRRIVD